MADSKEIDGGGFAFPWSVKIESGSFNPFKNRVVPKGEADCEVFTGMTLRDWFAGQALVGLVEIHNGIGVDPIGTARAAYQFADAMLKARKGEL